MSNAVMWLSLALVLPLLVSCQMGRHSPSGFRLPAGGDLERGKALFVSLGCNACHEVAGSDLPKPTMQPPVGVVLGGTVDYQITDGSLVSSIINPSHHKQVRAGGKTRMPDLDDVLTVRQLTDLVAYLQSQYRRPEVVPVRYF